MSETLLNRSLVRQQGFYLTLASLTVIAITIFSSSQLLAASCDDYNAVPPFLSAELAPNVMIMLDNSGSMKASLGSTVGYRCNNTDTAFDSTTTYYGMFDSEKTYSYDTTIAVDPTPFSGAVGAPYNVAVDTTATGAFIEDSACTLALGNNCWSGNFLNWIVTRRIDAARQVMIGGKVESRAGYDYIANGLGDLEWKIVGNNERSDYSICKSTTSPQNVVSPFPDTSIFIVSSPAENGATQTAYDPYAKITNLATNRIVDGTGTVIGEIGFISSLSANTGPDSENDGIDDTNVWKTVFLSKTDYVNPVVIARPLSYNGPDPSVARVNNVQAGSFDLRLEEWEYRDGPHTNEAISYIVIEAGSYTLGNNQRLVANKATIDDTWASVASLGFASQPIILTTVNSNLELDTVTTRLKNVAIDGSFDIQLQEEEGGDAHGNEAVAYLALEQGTYDVGLLSFEVDTITNVTEAWSTISFASTKQSPTFLADMQTTNDTDPAALRYRSLGSDSVQIFADEEDSVNDDVTHSGEDVGYVAISTPTTTNINIALIVDEEPTGLLQDLEGDVRLGISFYRYQKTDVEDSDTDIYNGEWAHGGTMSLDIPDNPFIMAPVNYRTVDTPIKAPLADIIDAIEHYPLVWGTTPLAENYYEILNYFQQETPYYEDKPTIGTTYNYKLYDSTDSTTTLWDPYYYDEYATTIRCAKSFVLIFTDGEPYKDDYVPYFYDHSGNGGTADTVDYDNDDSDFNLTPPFDETGDCSDTDDDQSNTCDDTLDDLSYWAYWDIDTSDYRDLRDDAAEPVMTGNQHIETYTIAFGRSTIPAILQDTADNGSGEAYAAEDGLQLETALADAFSNILTKVSAGSSISVLSERATEGSVIHQALFYPEKSFVDGGNTRSLAWIGALNTYWFFNSGTVSNIREDNTVGTEYYLDTHTDHALDFRIDAEGSLNIDYYSLIDSTGDDDGKAAALQGTYDNVDDISRIWDGGLKLLNRTVEASPSVVGNHGLRTIYGINESGTMSEFLADNFSLFQTNMRLDDAQLDIPDCLGIVADSTDQPVAGKLEEIRARNLISYTRGAADDFSGTTDKVLSDACRSRVVNDAGDIWKLGDIIYSTPQVIDNDEFSIVLASANDGMLHAFHAGKIRNDGLTTEQKVRLCDSNSGGCTQNEVGEELWAFIPQNAMPYLKYLTDPEYKHIYTTDMAPYRIKHGTKDIIIGGMRFGGATGCTDDSQNTWCGDLATGTQIVPPSSDPATPEAAIGYSSYFALDVSDPRNPVFLWEFTHPELGLTYSGPAYIRRGGNGYIMFTSGPLNYRAETDGSGSSTQDDQNLNVFVLKVDDDFKMVDVNNDAKTDSDDIFKFTGDINSKAGFISDSRLASYHSAFGGRLFTNGIDYDRDGNTDIVFFGVNDSNGTAGTVIAIVPSNGTDGSGNISYDPTDKADVSGAGETANWYFDPVLDSTTFPVTTKVIYGDCFNYPMIYFGTGRWFYKDDSLGINDTRPEELYGILIKDCLDAILAGDTCSINFAQNTNDICTDVAAIASAPSGNDTLGWVVDDLKLYDGTYGKERTTTDPTYASGTNIVFLTTMQPSSNPCDFGGRSRMWALNCMSGDSIYGGCPGYTTDYRDGSLLLQLSGGNIEGADLTKDDFPDENYKATPFYPGLPPESGTPFIPPSPNLTGEILLWLEK